MVQRSAEQIFREERQIQERASHTLLMILGVIFGGLAFGIPTFLQIHAEKYDALSTNYINEPYASGSNYVPLNVSEMVHDVTGPEGKAFFALSFISVVFLLMSYYPWKLVNVYVGQAAFGPTRLAQSLASIHHLAPPVGMLMVALIPVKARNANFGHLVCNVFHTVGAVGMIGGYIICELHCLFCHSHNKQRIPKDVRLKLGEWSARFALIFLCIVFAIGYIAFDAVNGIYIKTNIWDCADVYKVPTESDRILMSHNLTLLAKQVTISDAIIRNKEYLYNTASGMCLFVKRGSFWCECFAGVFMLWSIATVWYYCPERKVCDLLDALAQEKGDKKE